MKFLIKSLGWDGWRAAYERRMRRCSPKEARGCRSIPKRLRRRPRPIGRAGRAGHSARLPCARQARRSSGPGIVPQVRPSLSVSPEARLRWLRRTFASRSSRATRSSPRPCRSVTSRASRCASSRISRSPSATAPCASRPTRTSCSAGCRSLTSRPLYEHLAAAGLSLPDAGTIADVTSCPGAESCRLAVTQSRGLGKLLGDHLRERPHLVDAAPDVHIKISGCPNGCGQHHVAGIGFQGSIRKIAGRAGPAVLRDGRRRRGPRRRTVRAGSRRRSLPGAGPRRWSDCLRSTRTSGPTGETATAFFGRVDLPRLKQVLADLERLAPEDAVPADFIDLGEDAEFAPEVLDGECSA